MQSDVLRFSCPHCEAPLKASREAIGRPLDCPKCQRKLTVPEFPGGGWDDEEEYQLRAADSPQVPEGDEPFYISVNCSVCHTRMFARKDELGQMLACPDCGKKNLVSGDPAAETAKGKNRPDSFEPLLDDDGANPFDEEDTGLPSPDAYIPVECKKCTTRYYAKDEDVGHRLNCPDCRALNVVLPPAEGVSKPDRSAYEVNDAPKVAAPGTRLEDYDIEIPEEATLPDHPLIAGVFSFPFYAAVWPRWLMLSAWSTLTVVVSLSILAASANSSSGSAFDDRPSRMGALLLVGLVGGMSVLSWIVMAGMYFLHVISDTAIGNDELSEWPENNFFENFFNFFFIFVALLLSSMPGAIIAAMLVPLPPPFTVYFIAGALSVYLFFPYFLLSMGESDNPFVPVSASVLQKMRERPGVWVAIYFESAVLISAVLGAAFLFYAIVLATGISPQWQAPPTLFLACWALFVYFRLLGRAAWCFEYADRKAHRIQQQVEKRARQASLSRT